MRTGSSPSSFRRERGDVTKVKVVEDFLSDPAEEVVMEITVPVKYHRILQEMVCDLQVLVEKNAVYGESWKRRGGPGAFLTMVRPWDRLEEMVKRHNWDVFAAGQTFAGGGDSDIMDSIRDMRNYLYLIGDEILQQRSFVRLPQLAEPANHLIPEKED